MNIPVDLVDKDSKASEEKFVEVACGKYHNLALTRDGTIYSWGVNRENILGRRIEESKTAAMVMDTEPSHKPMDSRRST